MNDMRYLINLVEKAAGEFLGALHYDDWNAFFHKLDAALLNAETEIDLCIGLGIDHELFRRVISSSIMAWRDSTSTSMLHGIGLLDGIPAPGAQIFPDILWQTRFLTKAKELELPLAIHFIRNPTPTRSSFGKIEPYLTVRGSRALTADNVGGVNDLLRIIYAYGKFNASRTIKKLPRVIFRGIRAQDLYGHADLNDIMNIIWAKDSLYQMKRKEAIDTLISFIIKHGLNQISDGRILSFTAARPVADYFTRGEGFIIALDPASVEIVTSELHDPDRIAGRDEASGKNEREYIVRIPDSFKWKKDNFIINDQDYFIAEVNPLCVALLSHDDKAALYNMSGHEIYAQFYWSYSGKGGRLLFSCGEDHAFSRRDFQKKYGFDPLPNVKNLGTISNFRIKKVKRW